MRNRGRCRLLPTGLRGSTLLPGSRLVSRRSGRPAPRVNSVWARAAWARASASSRTTSNWPFLTSSPSLTRTRRTLAETGAWASKLLTGSIFPLVETRLRIGPARRRRFVPAPGHRGGRRKQPARSPPPEWQAPLSTNAAAGVPNCFHSMACREKRKLQMYIIHAPEGSRQMHAWDLA